MGTTEAPTMASPISPTVDKIPQTRDYQRGPDQQHSFCQTISNAMVRRPWIWHRRIQWKWPSMAMENPWCMAWKTYVEPPRIPIVSSDHLHDHPSIGSVFTHLGINIQLSRTGMDAQSIFLIQWMQNPTMQSHDVSDGRLAVTRHPYTHNTSK